MQSHTHKKSPVAAQQVIASRFIFSFLVNFRCQIHGSFNCLLSSTFSFMFIYIMKKQKMQQLRPLKIPVSAEQTGWSARPKIWFHTTPSNPTNMHRKLDVSLLPSARKIGLPHHQFQTRAFVVMWWPHKSTKSRCLCLHLQILVSWPPSPLSSCPSATPLQTLATISTVAWLTLHSLGTPSLI